MADNKNTIFFPFWTERENELMNQRGLFAIAINFGEDRYVEDFIYEYDELLQHMLDISSDAIYTGAGYEIHHLLKIQVQKQFIVAVRKSDMEVSLVGHYETETEAVSAVEKKTCDYTLKIKTNSSEIFTRYVIIDLSKTIPFFLGIGKLRKPIRTGNAGVFYGIDTMTKMKHDLSEDEL